MDFVHFLSSHMLDPKTRQTALCRHSAQAVHAEACGYRGVAIPEHHLVNILLVPSPLQMAVAIAARTSRLALMTSICQLPLRDMRVFAGRWCRRRPCATGG
ncbi:MAG: LLM class flavin-dependent oxidoreductase [Rhodobacter sp.]|nr:LLM class flavin-dependent oxidoreductase [Rhodobacter sp.]